MIRWLALGLLSLGLLACANSPPRATSVARVDSELGAAEVAFEKALAEWLHADQDAGEDALNHARHNLDAVVAACVAQAECDVGRALAAQSRAIERMQLALVGRRAPDSSEEVLAVEALADAHPVVPLEQLPEVVRSVALLKGRKLDEVIRVNEAVKAAMEEWLTWMRPNLLDTHENYQYLRHRMWPVYESAGLPEALLFGLLAKESGGKVHAVSRAGAVGLLQFMPATASRYGLSRNGGFDERFDARRITEANVAYFNDQFRVFNDDLELALAAYNGGEGRVGRLAGGGGHSFWEPRVYNALPPETRDYVPMVLAAAWLYLHPDDYGLVFPQIDASPSGITLERAASINELAVCMGQFGNARGWFRTLRNLNPRTEADTRIAAGTTLDVPKAAADAYAARCRSGLLAARSVELHDARKPQATLSPQWAQRRAKSGDGKTHVVQKGETLHSISKRFGCAVAPVAAANQLQAPQYLIRVGQRLNVPTSCLRA